LILEESNGYISLFSCCSYPSLRVAYIDEVEKTSEDKSKKMVRKVYYSALVKAAPPTKSIDSSDPVQRLDQVII
jgi:callose synthase